MKTNLSPFRVTIHAGGARSTVTVLAPDRKHAIAAAADQHRKANDLAPSAAVIGTIERNAHV